MAAGTLKEYQIKFTGNTDDLDNKVQKISKDISVVQDEAGNVKLHVDVDKASQKSIDEVFKQFLNDPENLKIKLQIDYDKTASNYLKLLDTIKEKRNELSENKGLQDLISFDKNDKNGPQKTLDKMVASIEEMDKAGVNANTVKKRIRDTKDFIESVGKKLNTDAFDNYIKNSEKYSDALEGHKTNKDIFNTLSSNIYRANKGIADSEKKLERYKKKMNDLLREGAKEDGTFFMTQSNRSVTDIVDKEAEEASEPLLKEAGSFDKVADAAGKAARAKLEFVNNNEQVKESARQSIAALKDEVEAMKEVSKHSSSDLYDKSYDYVSGLQESKERIDGLIDLYKRSKEGSEGRIEATQKLQEEARTRPEMAKYVKNKQVLSQDTWHTYLADLQDARPYLSKIGYDFTRNTYNEQIRENAAKRQQAAKEEKEVLDERVVNIKKFLGNYKKASDELKKPDKAINALTGGIAKEDAQALLDERLKEYRGMKGAPDEERAKKRREIVAAAYARGGDPYEGLSNTTKKNLTPTFNKFFADLKETSEKSARLQEDMRGARVAIEDVTGMSVDAGVLDAVASGMMSVDDAAKKLIEDSDKLKSQPQPLYSELTMQKMKEGAKDAPDPVEKYNNKPLEERVKYLREIGDASATIKKAYDEAEGVDDGEEVDDKKRVSESEYADAVELVSKFEKIFGAGGVSVTGDGFENIVKSAEDLEGIDFGKITNIEFLPAQIAEATEAEEKLGDAAKEAAGAVESQGDVVTVKAAESAQGSADSIAHEGESAQKAAEDIQAATVSKINFTEANMKVASSAEESVDAVDKEAESIKSLVDSADKVDQLEPLTSLVDEPVDEKSDKLPDLVENTSGIEKETDDLWELVTAEQAAADAQREMEAAQGANDSGIVQTGEALSAVRQKAADAATSVLEFIKNNSYLAANAPASSGVLTDEAQAFDKVTESAGNAAQKKASFNEANKAVATGAQESAAAVEEEARSMKGVGDAAEKAGAQKKSSAKKTGGKNEDEEGSEESLAFGTLKSKAERMIKSLVELQVRDAKDLNGHYMNEKFEGFIKARNDFKNFAKDKKNLGNEDIQAAYANYFRELQAQMERVLIDTAVQVKSKLEKFQDANLKAETKSNLSGVLKNVDSIIARFTDRSGEANPITDEEFADTLATLWSYGYKSYSDKDNLYAPKLDVAKLRESVIAAQKKYADSFDTSGLDDIIKNLSGEVTQGVYADLGKKFQIEKTKLASQAEAKRKADAEQKKIEGDQKRAENEQKQTERRTTASTMSVDDLRKRINSLLSTEGIDDSLRQELEQINQSLSETRVNGDAADETLSKLKKVDLSQTSVRVEEIANAIKQSNDEAKAFEADQKKQTATTKEVDAQRHRVNTLLGTDGLDDSTREELTKIAEELYNVRENSERASEGLAGISKVDLHAKEEDITNISEKIKLQAEEAKKAKAAEDAAQKEQAKRDAEETKRNDKRLKAVRDAREKLNKDFDKTQNTLDSDEHLSSPFQGDLDALRDKLSVATNGEDIHQVQIAYRTLLDSINEVTDARAKAAAAEQAEADERQKSIDTIDKARKEYDEINESVNKLGSYLTGNASSFINNLFKVDESDVSKFSKILEFYEKIGEYQKLAGEIGRGDEAAAVVGNIKDVLSSQLLSESERRLNTLQKYGGAESITGLLKHLMGSIGDDFSLDFIKRLKSVWDEADNYINGIETVGSNKRIASVQNQLDALSKSGVDVSDLQARLDNINTDTPVAELRELEEEIQRLQKIQDAKAMFDDLNSMNIDGIIDDNIKYIQAELDRINADTPVSEIQRIIEMIDEAKVSASGYAAEIKDAINGYSELAKNADKMIKPDSSMTGVEREQKRAWEARAAELEKMAKSSPVVAKAQGMYEEALSAARQRAVLSQAKAIDSEITKRLLNPKATDEYKASLMEMKESLGSIVGLASKGITFDSSDFDTANKKLSEMKENLSSMRDKSSEFASLSQVLGVLRKVTADIENNNLSGSMLDKYEDLREVLSKVAEEAQRAGKELTTMTADELLKNNNLWKSYNTEMMKNGMAGKGFMDQFRDSIRSQSANFLAQYFSLQDFIRYGKEIAQTVTSLDSAMVELRKVSGETGQRLDISFEKSAQTAKELGAEITSVINSTADWSRLGYSIDESEELARVTQIYQNVGDNLTQETASEYLVSTLQGFHIEADKALRVVDSINAVANNYAVDTQMIGESLERSAASFSASGTSLDKSIALVSATAEVTQDAASAGRMMPAA